MKAFAVKNKYESIRLIENDTLAERDLFDIHTFFMKGFSYKDAIIQEQTGMSGPKK